MKRVMVVGGAIGATMTAMTVIGPRGVTVRTTMATGLRVVFATTCQLPGPMKMTALLARPSEAHNVSIDS
jgi:hypothetical protein